jgi:hypothetical protein
MLDTDKNNDNIKNKDCVICKNIVNNDNLDKSLKEIIIEYINKGFKHEEIIIVYNKIKNKYTDEIILSSPYYLTLHQQKCLGLDLKELREKRKFNNKISVDNYKSIKNNFDNTDEKVIEDKNISFQEHINMSNILDNYRNMSFQERESDYLRILRKVDYMSLVAIHHQLLYGKMNKYTIVPKEDIGALKNVQDILQVLTENSFDDEEIPEININVINPQLVNEEILQQYEFPLSKDIAEKYKQLKEKSNENNYDIEDINNENNYDDNNDIEEYNINEESNIEENNIEESNNEDNKENDNGDWNR